MADKGGLWILLAALGGILLLGGKKKEKKRYPEYNWDAPKGQRMGWLKVTDTVIESQYGGYRISYEDVLEYGKVVGTFYILYQNGKRLARVTNINLARRDAEYRFEKSLGVR